MQHGSLFPLMCNKYDMRCCNVDVSTFISLQFVSDYCKITQLFISCIPSKHKVGGYVSLQIRPKTEDGNLCTSKVQEDNMCTPHSYDDMCIPHTSNILILSYLDDMCIPHTSNILLQIEPS